MSQGKWYGKIFCDEGVVTYEEFGTEAEAKAYVEGVKSAFHIWDTEHDDGGQDFYNFTYDQIKPEDE